MTEITRGKFLPYSIWLIRLIVAQLVLSSCSSAQFFDAANSFISRFNESNAIGSAAIDDTQFYCYWPEWTVTEPCVMAVELSTGRLVWSKPANLALPPTFSVDEDWLLYETTDGQIVGPNRTDGLRSLHIVNRLSGEETTLPFDVERNCEVDRPCVHRNRCVTSQGIVVDCMTGALIGDLGSGEHQVRTSNGDLFVVSMLFNDAKMERDKRVLRRFNISSMQLDREYEVSKTVPWNFVTALGEIMIGRTESRNGDSELVCIDLQQQKERWRVAFPKSILPGSAFWDAESRLILSAGLPGAIRPLIVEIDNGRINPDLNWQDPRLLLAWHSEVAHYPDLVVSNSRMIIGRWRFQQYMCVNSETGQLVWTHPSTNYLVTRLFSQKPSVGDYIVAESEKGFDIISVETGERRVILPPEVGLQPVPKRQRVIDGSEVVRGGKPLSRSMTSERLMDWGLLLAPLIPFVIWIFWSLVQRRNPFVENDDKSI